ncbi:MAG TPA: MBL fold metallo-hydrolase [Thermodesulfobacteriota bacterium]|nr:MBL fold metallo-hydrolase [Thermodesulfobacteriota bacterium]
MGVTRGYVLQEEGTVMIDGGAPGKIKAFLQGLKKASIDPQSITLLILTHGHWDHIGLAKEIKEITGAKIAMHEKERACLEKSLKPLPPGVSAWGRTFAGIMALFMPLVKIPTARVDILLGSAEFSLQEFGISGKIIPTPGHSPGSVSVLLPSGEAFVGDLAMNAFPMRLTPGLPIFADSLETVKESWRLLLSHGVKMIYPSHGRPFPVERIKNRLLEGDQR